MAFAETPGPPRRTEEARLAFDRAEKAAEEGQFEEALSGYEASASLDPGAPFAGVARARAADLKVHSEGGFAPLSRLTALRSDSASQRDLPKIEAFLSETATFPDGPVRGEARLFAAEALAHTLGAADRAAPPLRAVLADPFASRSTRAMALSALVGLCREAGDLDGAKSATDSATGLLPALEAEVNIEVRQRTYGRAAQGILVATGLLGLAGVAIALRRAARTGDTLAAAKRWVRPGAVAVIVYVGAGGALFARWMKPDAETVPFLWLGWGLFALHVIASAWAQVGPDARWAKAARAIVAFGAAIALGVWVAWRSSPGFLTTLGVGK